MKNSKPNHTTAVILSAGEGRRMNALSPKQMIKLCGETVLHRSARAFAEASSIDSIVVVVREEDVPSSKQHLLDIPKIRAIVSGGKTRAESAKCGFLSVPSETAFIAIHDAARCLITPQVIDRVVNSAIENGAATAGTKIHDTVKSVGDNGNIIKTIPRDTLFSAQTPQAFDIEIYSKAINLLDISDATDDNFLIEKLGFPVKLLDVGKENIKITTADDLEYAEFLLEKRKCMKDIRIGHGYDVHALTPGRKLILGGVNIEHELGLLGHSDADVLLHAIMDSLLGAASLGDIGRHFPDTDERYKGISSLELLNIVGQMLSAEGYEISNIDSTPILQRPKIASYIQKIEENIACTLKIDKGQVNVKATTEEHLGFTGREEGIAAHSVAVISKK